LFILMKRLFKALREFGPKEYARQWWQWGKFRGGHLVGVDEHGNRYYEVLDPVWMMPGRTRYVEYSSDWFWGSGDPSQIPAKWHGWMHYTHNEPQSARYSWEVQDGEHQENMTGTDLAYRPWSTVPPKITAFTGHSIPQIKQVKPKELAGQEQSK
jgi:NADH:ubiquinone oxidoreductase subunit